MNRTSKTLALAVLAAAAFQAQATPANAADAKKKQNFASLINMQDNFAPATGASASTNQGYAARATLGAVRAMASTNPFQQAYLNRQYFRILYRQAVGIEQAHVNTRLAKLRSEFAAGTLNSQQFALARSGVLQYQQLFNRVVASSLNSTLGQLRVQPLVLPGTQLRTIAY